MKMPAIILAAHLLGGAALATTWSPTEMTDPIAGEKVRSQAIMSYGSYIYRWPSKYDLVFWPLTDANWICLNPANGYAAFNNDFETLPDAEKEPLSRWLEENYEPGTPPMSHKEKLAWLEKVYGQRKMDDEFWCQFYRLMAYIHAEDEATSLAYVRKALPLLEKKWASNPEGIAKPETLYLLGEYHRRLGDVHQAQAFFAQANAATYTDRKGHQQTGNPFIAELIQDRLERLTEAPSGKPEAPAAK